jgi:hypothetical protein
MPGTGPVAAAVVAGNEAGITGRSHVRSAVLFCSPVHGPYLRKHGNDLVAGIGVHSSGPRGRRFKSGRPDRFFELLYPKVGTKPTMIIPT